MEKLKQIIESALEDNLNAEEIGKGVIENVSNIIAQEVKDIAIQFAKWRYCLSVVSIRRGVNGEIYMLTEEELFNQFINEKYK